MNVPWNSPASMGSVRTPTAPTNATVVRASQATTVTWSLTSVSPTLAVTMVLALTASMVMSASVSLASPGLTVMLTLMSVRVAHARTMPPVWTTLPPSPVSVCLGSLTIFAPPILTSVRYATLPCSFVSSVGFVFSQVELSPGTKEQFCCLILFFFIICYAYFTPQGVAETMCSFLEEATD